MGDETPHVLIIDDDREFRDSVARLLRTVGLHTGEFSSVSEFLKADPWDGPSCLVLDVRMPGRSGLELQRDRAGMRKMKAGSLPELSRMAGILNLRPEQPRNF